MAKDKKDDKDFWGQETNPGKPSSSAYSYMDGFRLGFGFFVAWLIGWLAVGGIIFGISKLLDILR